jgi:hypothetical protein
VIGTDLRSRGKVWQGKQRGRIMGAKGLDHFSDTGYIVVGRAYETEENQQLHEIWNGNIRDEILPRILP